MSSLPRKTAAIHCRIGSLEKARAHQRRTHAIHCRIGSSEICRVTWSISERWIKKRDVLIARARFRATYCPASPWVFCNHQGLRIGSVKKSFASAVRQAGLEDVHPHDLRRTFGSWLVQAGVSIQAVSALLHSDIRITDRIYAHLSPESLREAVDVLNTGEPVSRLGFTLPEDSAKPLKSSS